MCENCFLKGIYRFESYHEFEMLERLIDEKIRKGILEGRSEKNELSFYSLTYLCSSCNQKWFISDPDNNWRGYFLPAELAIDFENKIARRFDNFGF